jgi:hypothetical protein
MRIQITRHITRHIITRQKKIQKGKTQKTNITDERQRRKKKDKEKRQRQQTTDEKQKTKTWGEPQQG